jgi:RimJ/RimL family protein N-acetyltransferase
MSFDPNVIPEETHRRWLAELLKTAGEQLFIAEMDGVAIGTGRLTAMGKSAIAHLTIAPASRGRGYAAEIICSLVDEARRQERERVEAYIKTNNAASIRAFLRAGFCEIKADESIVTMEFRWNSTT